MPRAGTILLARRHVGRARGRYDGARERSVPGLCEVCGKHTVFGRRIRHKHSGRWNRKAPKTSRTFKPNISRRRFKIDGKTVRINICTRCLRTMLKVKTV